MYHLLFPIVLLILPQLFEEKQETIFVDPRDSNEYSIVQLNGLNWLGENLRFRAPSKKDTIIDFPGCGVFYLVEDAASVCPEGWRLPSENEVSALIKANKKGKLNLIDTLRIELCGRMDYDTHAKYGAQNTFWLNEPLEEGHVSHWHTFGNKHEVHTHDVVNAKRRFPVRCVCEIE